MTHSAGKQARAIDQIVRAVLLMVLATAVLVLVAVGAGPRLGLYRTMTVLSGSMRPTFNPGDMIVVRPEPLRDVRVGQVIAYTVPVAGGPVATHRVIRVLKGGAAPVVQTQGDANSWRDPWTAQLHGTTAWRLTAVVPYAGFGINLLRSPLVHGVAIFGSTGLLVLLFLAEIWELPLRKKNPSELVEAR